MTVLGERNAHPKIGAEFFRDNGDAMFQFVIDPGNIIGPRLATMGDRERHPTAWLEFIANDAPPPPPTPISAPADETAVVRNITPARKAAATKSKRKYTRRKAA